MNTNAANALKSTGPITHEGKAISSLNALKTGLTGRTVLLHSDDAAQYQRHIQDYEKEYQPVGLRERELVQSLADTQWRLQRIPGLEMAIYAQGLAENQDYCKQHSSVGSNLIELGTFLKYEKQLRNLQIHEARLQRRYEKEMAELRALQKERTQAGQQPTAPQAVAEPRRQVNNGFEFSTRPQPKLMEASGPALLPSATASSK